MRRLITLLLLVILLALSVVALTKSGKAPRKRRVIHFTAKKFDFVPASITIKKGEPVTIELTSADAAHGFRLPEFGLRAEIKPGVTTSVSFVPNKTGTFNFHCDVFCGEGHEDMTGTIVVTE